MPPYIVRFTDLNNLEPLGNRSYRGSEKLPDRLTFALREKYVVKIGFDYNHGENVILDSETDEFVVFDF